MSPEQLLQKWRACIKRLHTLLEAEERNVMVQAEIVHAAAHLADYSAELDLLLAAREARQVASEPEAPPVIDVS